jgi:clan AA aspartic protease
MARETGSVNAQLEAWIRIRAASGQAVECLIDTGFNGALMLPRAITIYLNLSVLGRVPIEMAGGVRSVVDVAELEVDWLGGQRWVEVIISEGEDSLIGTELLDGTRLVIDYAAHIASISDESN